MPHRIGCLLALFVVLAASDAGARTWLVGPDGSGDAPTIQAAFDSAVAGDQVVLAPGTYTRSSQGVPSGPPIATLEAGVALLGEAGAPSTIVDGQNVAANILRGHDVGSVVVEGITFRAAGEQFTDTRAVYITGAASPTFRACVFDRNVSGLGGGVRCGAANFEDCTFTRNSAASGGGVWCVAARFLRCTFSLNVAGGVDGGSSGGAVRSQSATFEQCTFEENGAGSMSGAGGAVYDDGVPVFLECDFRRNRVMALTFRQGGALFISGPGTVTSCLFVSNQALEGSAVRATNATLQGCVFLGNSGSAAVHMTAAGRIEACTFVGNAAGIAALGAATITRVIVAGSTGAACTGTGSWSCSDFFGNGGGNALCGTDAGGNFTADPRFCAANPIASENVDLLPDSPCAPGNHPLGTNCGLIGAGPVECGSVHVEPRTWSRVKSLFRD